MSSERDKVRELAGRVARQLADVQAPSGVAASAESADLDALRTALGEIQRRLAHIESHLAHDDGECAHGASAESEARGASHTSGSSSASSLHGAQHGTAKSNQTPTGSMWLSGTYVPAVSHPSQERFTNVGEAVSELVEFFQSEKTCSIEPGNKPCDHCGMCSSRGF
jgi:hypothetical protein